MLMKRDDIARCVDSTALGRLVADPEYRPPNLAQAGRGEISFAIPRLAIG